MTLANSVQQLQHYLQELPKDVAYLYWNHPTLPDVFVIHISIVPDPLKFSHNE